MYLEAVKAIRAVLVANGTLAASMDSRWYRDYVAGEPTYPYGIISLNAGAQNNESAMVEGDLRFLVKVVGQDQTANAQLAEEIRSELHEASLSADSPVAIWRCQAVGLVHFLDVEAQIPIAHDGGIYRLRLNTTN